MKNLKAIFAMTIITMIVMSSCSKEEVTSLDVADGNEQEVPHFDETNSETYTWDQLPSELRDAKPLSELENIDERGYCPNNSQSGSWGGNGGSSFNYKPTNCAKIYAMAIRSGSRVDRLVVWYKDFSTNTIYVGLDRGGSGGNYHLQFFSTDGSEFIRKVAGRSGSRLDKLSIYTNKKSFSYGGNGGSSFVFQPPYGNRIRGFYGRSGSEIDRIGFYGYDD